MLANLLKKIQLSLTLEQWHPHWTRDYVPLEDGGNATGWVMRRRDGGKIAYRSATEEEQEDAHLSWSIR